MNGVIRAPSGDLKMDALNDANAITYYRGIYHIMIQGGNRSGYWSGKAVGDRGWAHSVSSDLVHWHSIEPALGSGVNMSFPDGAPCDGSLSYPDIGAAPVILYDTACGTTSPGC